VVAFRLIFRRFIKRSFVPRAFLALIYRHRRNDRALGREKCRILAAGIPGARFVGLEGRNHLILETDPGWGRFQQEVAAFLAA
jgi:hypothetical protein